MLGIVLNAAHSSGSTTVFGRTVSLDQRSRDVPSSHHHFTWPKVPGSARDHLQRLFVPALALDFPSN